MLQSAWCFILLHLCSVLLFCDSWLTRLVLLFVKLARLRASTCSWARTLRSTWSMSAGPLERVSIGLTSPRRPSAKWRGL
ncbi:hypothetical protein C8J56DRAFT_932142 [Mycena floridula]|nr:hypothetical protein C8J56DRAFT_932142 [Mycena floridula]